MIDLRIFGAVYQGDVLFRKRFDLILESGIRLHLRAVSATELGKSIRSVIEPDSQRRCGGPVLVPLCQGHLVLGTSTRPQSIHEDSEAVRPIGILIRAFDGECSHVS
jgi:hypothetical protein